MRLGVLSLVSLVLPLAASAVSPHGSQHHSRHAEIARRRDGDVQLHKRFSQSKWSFYDVGLGACGEYNVESEFIVALNTPQYGGGYPGPNCFKTITMTYNGKTAQATIMDQCPGCPFGGLDLSRSLFRHFAAESVGIIYGSWSFNGGSGDGGGGDTKPTPKTTKKPDPTTEEYVPPKTTRRTTTRKPEPTTTSERPDPTTTTERPDPTTSTTKTSTSRTTQTSQTSQTKSTETSASIAPVPVPVPTSTPQQALVINDLNNVLLNLGGLIVAGAAA
ncbi:Allergen Asp f 7 [Hypsizygus marmoreus]|uniref:Allergen Asp f 7 n=1 Tax=Hypsizygus marmoreus TaxID=39966 RepID=A0A369JZE3_HYPMA|nr:Allergen Asp f 7 [Hypsizygus marmoreus]